MQKFKKGDLVRVAKNLGPFMSHFTSDCDAIVLGSYKDQYGGSDLEDTIDYTIYTKKDGESSWYEENQLTLIEHNRIDLLKLWKEEKKKENKLHSDLDWIFANGESVLNHPTNATIEALGSCAGLNNLWGSHGEGYVYYQNAITILHFAKPFLESCDKSGWLTFCAKKGWQSIK